MLRVSRNTVDQLLRLARREARLFIADPEPWTASAEESDLQWPVSDPGSPRDLVLSLREAILRSGDVAACLDDRRLESCYQADLASSVPTATVAHVVSCGPCLDRVNRRLGLPLLADRHPLDSLGYDRDSRPPSSNAGGGRGAPGERGAATPPARRRLDEARRRLTDLISPEPLELRVGINGVILGRQ